MVTRPMPLSAALANCGEEGRGRGAQFTHRLAASPTATSRLQCDDQLGFVAGMELNAQKARVLLMFSPGRKASDVEEDPAVLLRILIHETGSGVISRCPKTQKPKK